MSSLAPLLCPGLEAGFDGFFEGQFRGVWRKDYYSAAEVLPVLDRQALAVVCKATHAAGYLSANDLALLRVLQFLHGRRPPRSWFAPPTSPGDVVVGTTGAHALMIINLYLARTRPQVVDCLTKYQLPYEMSTHGLARIVAQCLLLDGTDRLLDVFLPGAMADAPAPLADGLWFEWEDVGHAIIAQAFLAGGWKMAFDPSDEEATSTLHRVWRCLDQTEPDWLRDSSAYLALVGSGGFSLLRRYRAWPSMMPDLPFDPRDHPELVGMLRTLLDHLDDGDPDVRAWFDATMQAWPYMMTWFFAEVGEQGAPLWRELCNPGVEPHVFLVDCLLFGTGMRDAALPALVALMRTHPAWGAGLPLGPFLDRMWPDEPYVSTFSFLHALVAEETTKGVFDWTGAAGHMHYLPFLVELLEVGGARMLRHLIAVQPRTLPAAPFNVASVMPSTLFIVLAEGKCLEMEWEAFLDALFPDPFRHFARFWDSCLEQRPFHGTAAETWWAEAPQNVRALQYFRKRGARLTGTACAELLLHLVHEQARAKLGFFLDHGIFDSVLHGAILRDHSHMWMSILDPQTVERLRVVACL